MRPVDSTPADASERINTTAARLEDDTNAIIAEKMRATGQALSNKATKAMRAGELRMGSVAALKRWSESNISPIPTSALPPP